MNRPSDTAVPRALPVTQHVAAFLHDLVKLLELQGRLFAVELHDCRARLLTTVATIVAGLALGLSGMVVGLLALGWLLAENSRFSTGQACLISATGGLLAAVAIVGMGMVRWRRRHAGLARSWDELRQNVAWIKSSLERLAEARNGSNAAHESDGDQPFS
ncbi:MAG: phage holin family protein [Planctomycetaceae bacterium]